MQCFEGHQYVLLRQSTDSYAKGDMAFILISNCHDINYLAIEFRLPKPSLSEFGHSSRHILALRLNNNKNTCQC